MRHAREYGPAIGIAWAVIASLLLSPARSHAAGDEEPYPASGSLVGNVIDNETKEPVGWVTLLLVEIRCGEISHADGSFHFHDVPPGRYSLRVSHLGYQTLVREITISDGDTAAMMIELAPTPLQGQPAVVVSERNKQSYTPAEVLSGTKLQQRLGRTLAETIGSEAGVSQQSMGPAPARPVVRGLGGDRLLILQDGDRTGDLSASSSDHAVTVDPLTAERVEIVQGPASLLYSSHALGGIINVVRDAIAPTLPDRPHGIASLQAETVNNGYSAGLSFALPTGPLALQIEGSWRVGSDMTTPGGDLRNTDIGAYNGSAGVSLVDSWGHVGIGASTYSTEYGVPGGFVGAHPNGVRVEMDRKRVETRAEILSGESLVRRVELHAGYTRYHHRELESNGIVGAEYGVLTGEARATIHHGEVGPFERGAIGAWGEHRDFAAGAATSIPRTAESNLAAFLYEELQLDRVRLRAGIRTELRLLKPETIGPSRIGTIRDRSFAGIAGSASMLYPLDSGLNAEFTVMRSFRAPTLEELYSQGPHLASYSFETGNPDLKPETGLGMELSLRYNGERGHARASFFRNSIIGYIYPLNTGDTSFSTQLPIYQHTGNDVVMQGVELSGELELLEGIVAGTTLSQVRGTLAGTENSLPAMPPFNGRIDLRYRSGPFTVGATARGATAQNELGEFEERTAGYVVYDAFVQYQYITADMLHTAVLTLENAVDTEYRMHLSRVKAIMPEPGRNLKLLYRLYF